MALRRWWLLLLAGVLTTSGLVPAGSAAPAYDDARVQAARATQLTLRTSAEEAGYGDRVILSGKLTAGRRGVRGQKIVIRHRAGNARSWTKVATARTNRRGVWRKAVTVRVRGSWAATYKGAGRHAGSRSPKRRVDVFAPLTDFAVAPGGRDAYRDEEWTFTARTAPELAGGSVRLLRGPFRAPTTLRTATIGPGGAIAVTHRMTVVGQADYWVSVDGSALMFGADSPHASIRTRSEGAPTTPTIATTSLPTTEVHVPYQANLVGGGGELTWSALSALPPGLDLSPDGTVSGTPTQVGTWDAVVRASNVAGAASGVVTFTSAPGSLTVTTRRLYDAAVGQDYPDVPYSAGGWQEMFCTPCPAGAAWSVTSGTLPPGMAFADRDEFVDPPASYVYGSATQPGSYQFTVTAVADGRSGSKQFTLRVLPSPSDLISIDWDQLTFRVPDGSLGQPYSHQFTAQGGAGLTWTSLSPLPPGLTLSETGLLSGTPTQSGDGWIDVAPSDGTRYDWQGFLLAVNP